MATLPKQEVNALNRGRWVIKATFAEAADGTLVLVEAERRRSWNRYYEPSKKALAAIAALLKK